MRNFISVHQKVIRFSRTRHNGHRQSAQSIRHTPLRQAIAEAAAHDAGMKQRETPIANTRYFEVPKAPATPNLVEPPYFPDTARGRAAARRYSRTRDWKMRLALR